MGESCYIAVAGPENDIGECRDSIEQMTTRPGDRLWFARGTKGYEVRQTHFNRFIDSDHEWLLMLDHDMVYAADTLERLRGHNVKYVSGYYLQRRYRPMIPVWFHAGDEWPLRPFLEIPESGRLHELGGSGWGCVLIHRRVVEALLRGVAFRHRHLEPLAGRRCGAELFQRGGTTGCEHRDHEESELFHGEAREQGRCPRVGEALSRTSARRRRPG